MVAFYMIIGSRPNSNKVKNIPKRRRENCIVDVSPKNVVS